MLPLIPALILLLLSPATAERLAREGRFPAPLTVVALRGAREVAVARPQAAETASRRARTVIRLVKKAPLVRTRKKITVSDSRSPISIALKPSRDRDGPWAV
ncbi:hypothetical protein BH11ARM2_BH11ARM2_38350 [soil metagenome]